MYLGGLLSVEDLLKPVHPRLARVLHRPDALLNGQLLDDPFVGVGRRQVQLDGLHRGLDLKHGVMVMVVKMVVMGMVAKIGNGIFFSESWW